MHITVREELCAHVVEVVRSRKPPPGTQEIRVTCFLHIRFQGLYSAQGVVLQIISPPGGEVALCVCPGDEVGDIKSCHGRTLACHLCGCRKGEVRILQHDAGQGFHEVEDTCLRPLMLAKGLVVHEEVDGLSLAVQGEEPACILLGSERIFLPALVGEAEGNVVREAVVLQKKSYATAVAGLVCKVWRSPVNDLVGTFGEDGLVAHLLRSFCYIVVVDELGIAEGCGPDTEVLLHKLVMDSDLFHPLVGREEEGEGVGIGFSKDFHAARVYQFLEALQNIWCVLHHLFDKDAGKREGHLELAIVSLDELQEQRVHGQIALVRHLQHDGPVGIIVLVHVVVTNVEERVMPEPVGLMNLKVETDGRHLISPLRARHTPH